MKQNPTLWTLVQLTSIASKSISRRLSWNDYGMLIAFCSALRSEDPFTKVGCCALRQDNSVVSIGYNGAPSNVNIDWNNRDEKNKRSIHAEANTLRFCLPNEVKKLFITHSPCINCLSLISSYNIKEVIYYEEYHRDTNKESIKIAEELNIKIIKYDRYSH